MKKGLFITFEGPEGSGKTTHIQYLAHSLRQAGYSVTLTREPGGTAWADKLRDLLLNTDVTIFPLAELLLYEADRAQHVQESILPALKQGDIVLCDRYTDSTIAYQGYGRGIDRAIVDALNTIASGTLQPSLTILLDVPVKQGLQQATDHKNGKDRLEKAGVAFHQRVRKGFLDLARKDPKRFRIIQQQEDMNKTQWLVRQAVEAFLAKPSPRKKKTNPKL